MASPDFVLLGIGPTTTAPLFVLMGFGTDAAPEPPPIIPPTVDGGGGGGGGGGSTQNSRNRAPDFGVSGRNLRKDRQRKTVERSPPQFEEFQREAADAVIEKAQDIARARLALKDAQDARVSAGTATAQAKRVAAMEAKVLAIELDYEIARDDAEVLLILKTVLR